MRAELAVRALAASERNRPGLIWTGFFGVPGGGYCTKVHLVLADGKPACGVRLGPRSEFQFCASRPVADYVECRRCRRLLD